jgi:hypothetical protein
MVDWPGGTSIQSQFVGTGLPSGEHLELPVILRTGLWKASNSQCVSKIDRQGERNIERDTDRGCELYSASTLLRDDSATQRNPGSMEKLQLTWHNGLSSAVLGLSVRCMGVCGTVHSYGAAI